MNHQQAIEAFEVEADLYKYQRLHRWLTYGGYSFILWGGGFFAPVGLVAYLALGAAIVFVPIMIHDLAATKHWGWIVTWVILVFVPTLLVLVLGPTRQKVLWTALAFLPMSYIFFWILRMAVDTWMGTLQARLELILTRNPGRQDDA
jgi:hypothetical protein